MSRFVLAVCGFAAVLLPRPVCAAFEWTGPAGTRGAAGNPAELAGARGPGWRLSCHRRLGLPELAAHGVRATWGRSGLGVGASLALLGPDRHRELDLGLGLGQVLPGGRGAAGAGAHLLHLQQAGLPAVRRWVPAAGLALTPGGGWCLAAHGRGGAGGLAAAQVAVGLRRRNETVAVTAVLHRGGSRPWRLHLASEYRLGPAWRVSLGTRSAPRQFELGLSWSRGRLRLSHRLESHADLGPGSHLALEGGTADPPAASP